MNLKNVFVMKITLILSLLVACTAVKQAPLPTQAAQVLPASGIQYQFVTNKLLIPTTQAQTQEFALNIDGDAQQHADNLFGGLFTLLTSAAQDIELQSALDQAIDKGQIVSLHMLMADDPLNDSNASWSIIQGQKTQSPPSFDGSDKFTLDSAALPTPPIIGSLTNGHFAGGPGAAHAQILLLGQLVEVNLIGVRLEADVSAKGCTNAKLGGGITVDEFRSKLLPAITDGLNQLVKVNKTAASTLLQAFDADGNGVITIQELDSNPMLTLAFSPDLDLLDASGKFNPNQDGVKDSYSIGLGFTCVPATFPKPGN